MLDNNFSYSISVDCVIFGYDSTDLKVLLIKRGEKPYLDYWALPGDLIHSKESIDDSVKRVLKDLTGLSNVYMEQVKTFGDVGRHPLGRVFTIAYYSLLKIDESTLNPSSFAKEAKCIN
jgi:ADP-ribose pyrophosphatase